MAERISSTLPDLHHTSLLSLMPAEFEESVVRHVLTHKEDLPNDVRRDLHTAINSVVKVPKFRKRPAIAPAPLLIRPIIDRLASSEQLTNAVLHAWFASQDTLYAIVKNYLFSRNIDIEYPNFNPRRIKGTWSYDDWLSERDGVLAIHAELNEDDVALMLCFAAAKLPDDRERESSNDVGTTYPTVLLQALSFLDSLSADAPEWFADVPEFLSSASNILDRKRHEQDSVVAVHELNAIITDLSQYSGVLAYLELDLSQWSTPAGLSPAQVAQVRVILTDFSVLLGGYDPVPKMGSSFSETQRLRDDHDAATRSLLELKSALDEGLSSRLAVLEAPVELTPHHPVHIDQQESDRMEGLSDIRLSAGTLDFSPTQKNYSINLDNHIESLAITPVVHHIDVRVDLVVLSPDDEKVEGLASSHGTFLVSNIDVGRTVISINIAAGEGATNDTYTLSVIRAASTSATPARSSDASLESLHVLGTPFELPKGLTQINIDIPGELEHLTLVPEPAHVAATVTLAAVLSDGTTVDALMSDDGRFAIAVDALGKGDFTLYVVVTAENEETTQTYTVFAKRQPVHDAASIVWELVAQDDLAGAYWNAKSMVAQGLTPPAPPQVLKALQGVRWLSADSDAYVVDLFDIVGEFEPTEDNDAQTLLRLSAGLLPSLIAPETNLLAWLSSPRCLPALESIVSPIKAFAADGNPLRPEHITGDEGLQRLNGLIMGASAEARKWLEEAPRYQTRFSRAVKLWQYLSGEGILNQMLSPVSEDRRDQVNTVQGCVDALDRDGYAVAINQAENMIGGRPPKQGDIVGNARDWLVKRLEEAKELAATWCNFVSREASTRPGRLDRRVREQVSGLRSKLQAESPAVFEALVELSSDSAPQHLAASAKCAARSLQQLADYLNIDLQHEPPEQPPLIVQGLRAINLPAPSASKQGHRVQQLETAISRWLLWMPSIEIDDACVPVSDDRWGNLAQDTAYLRQNNVSLEEVLQSRMDHRDFRFSDVLMSGLSKDALDHNRNKCLAQLTIEKNTLREAIERTQTAVEQAEKDGVIEFEGSYWNLHQNSLDDLDVEGIMNFRPVYGALDAIKNGLQQERLQRRQELLEEWQTLGSRSEEDPDIDEEFLTDVSSTFERASSIDSLDIRVMQECASRLRNHQSREEGSVVRTNREEAEHQPLENFLTFYEGVGNPRLHAQESSGLNTLLQELTAGAH